MRLPCLLKRALICCSLTICIPACNAQEELIRHYLDAVGDNALVYSGELETIYNPLHYSSFPYCISDEYTDGSVVYRGNYYPDQKLRLDLFKDQLIILTPKSHQGVIVNPAHLHSARIHGRTLIYHSSPKGSELKTGYYFQLHDGKKLKLLGRWVMLLENPKDKVKKEFSLHQRYYILQEGKYYPVKNRSSFTKRFPAYKKQIKKFVRDNGLSFNADKENSLARLVQFCEEIIQSPNL